MHKILICALLFLLASSVLSINLDKPFMGEHDWNGVRYGNIARNYLRYNPLETKFSQIENSGLVEKQEFEYFTHYPPLLPILIALSYKIFGISEWSTRIVPVMASSGIIVIIFLIGEHLWSRKYGIFASLIALATPLFIYFGKTPVHESLVVFFVLLAYFGYLRKIKKLFLLGLIFAQISTWAGYFLLPALTLVAVLKRDFKEVKNLLPYWLLSLVLFSVHIIHIMIATGSIFGGNLLSSFLQRSGLDKEVQPDQFSLISYFDRLRIWFFSLYTVTLSSMVFIFIANKVLKVLKNKRLLSISDADWTIITLGIFGIIYPILFSNAAFIHNYLIFYLLPFFCLAATSVIKQFVNFKMVILNILFVFLLIIIILYEKKDIMLALLHSDADKFSVEVGKAIGSETNYGDVVLIEPKTFSYSADKFLRFYSNRELVYADSTSVSHNILVIVDEKKREYKILKNE